jgi:putative tricarboxylic transport membrane protein
MKETPEFIYAIFGAMLIANFMFLGIGLGGAKLFARVTLVPKNILWPAVFVFAVIGSFAFASSIFDVWVMMVAGILGFFMNRHGFGPAPLVMGLILGKLVEESFSQSMIIYDNEWWRLFEGPIVNLFFVLTAMSLFWPIVRRFINRKQ